MAPDLGIDILEDRIQQFSPELLETLLLDRTRTEAEGRQCHIRWLTADYEHLGPGYEYADEILPCRITGQHGTVIQPRVYKNRATQTARSKGMAEVFTPSWVCKEMNDAVDEAWHSRQHTWQEYVRDVRLEITCGEAPFLVSRYDTVSGEPIPVGGRIGLLDRKLRVVDQNARTEADWLHWATVAFQSVYGYEWQGDNLLLARENLLATYVDYYRARFGHDPDVGLLLPVADIISWNLWQMDGLRCVVPNSCKTTRVTNYNLLGEAETTIVPCPGCSRGNIRAHNGLYCLIRDWAEDRTLPFVDLMNN